MKYRNPIIPGFYPDPSICRAGDDYFLVTSSFEYFPGVPLFHSKDLVNWRQIGHCLTRDSQLPLGNAWVSRGIYAPTIRCHNGRFYMVTTNVSDGGNFYVWTDDPYGEWSEPIWVDQTGIDPDLYFDTDGTVYFTNSWRENGGCCIGQSTIDIETGRKLTETKMIWEGSGGKGPEAPHIYRIDGRYYLMIAEGGTEYGHMETIARSGTPGGPFESYPHNPILSHRSLASPIQVTGHGDVVQLPDGSWWMVFLAVRPVGYPPCHHLGRETFLAPVNWREDGWPEVGIHGTVQPEMEGPSLPPQPWEPEPVRDDFDTPGLRLCWNFIRNPRPENCSLTERPGYLCLYGGQATIDTMESPAWVGRRQCHFNCRAETLLHFEPENENEEAGLTVFQNYAHHYEIAVTRMQGERRVIARRRIGSLRGIVASVAVGEGPVRLRITADPQSYELSFTIGNAERTVMAAGETRYLSTEVGGRFTGVYFAMYATGNGTQSATPAYFDWFDYEGQDDREA